VVRPEYASVLINGFNDSGIQITWFFFTDPQKKTPFLVTRELNLQLFEIFKKYGIDIPYSHTTVTV
jgi:small-conductance mechanosensitive channel